MDQIIINILKISGTAVVVLMVIVIILIAIGLMRMYFDWVSRKLGYGHESIIDKLTRLVQTSRKK